MELLEKSIIDYLQELIENGPDRGETKPLFANYIDGVVSIWTEYANRYISAVDQNSDKLKAMQDKEPQSADELFQYIQTTVTSLPEDKQKHFSERFEKALENYNTGFLNEFMTMLDDAKLQQFADHMAEVQKMGEEMKKEISDQVQSTEPTVNFSKVND